MGKVANSAGARGVILARGESALRKETTMAMLMNGRVGGWVAGLLVLAAGAAGGPPGVCNQVALGERQAEFERAWSGVRESNVRARMGEVLDGCVGTLERMEAIRRCAAMDADDEAAREVIPMLALRATLRLGTPREAAAIFDVGYAVHAYGVLDSAWARGLGVVDGVPGYAMVARAIEVKPDAGMHVGAAFMTLPALRQGEAAQSAVRTRFEKHARAAAEGLSKSSAEAVNLRGVLEFDPETEQALALGGPRDR